ncbi:MAG: GNAT family N-acetyltransferase [Actinomycetia bacterium]|nr:GNAT family N-acetyltransferase [Actinomycetes bacterium]
MSDDAKTSTRMPTGEEPPKGFEALATEKPAPGSIDVRAAFTTQLAGIEIAEIEKLRVAAMANIANAIGTARVDISFADELDILKPSEDAAKMLFRAYRNDELVGYALVIIGWPQKPDWIIQHMIVNPNNRLQGVGTAIVSKIETDAQDAEVATDNLYVIPIDQNGLGFWQMRGYNQQSESYEIKIADRKRNISIYHKKG